jgi:(1->4)-alpha-D-glucan 1-alpha-D-glucosylmutase
VPDIYQGTELWDFSLVDPDNRRPVDFAHRRQALDELLPIVMAAEAGRPDGAALGRLLAGWEDGRIKLFITAAALRWRRRHPDVVLDGSYVPLQAEGPAAEHLVTFARHHVTGTLVVMVPRLTVALTSAHEPLPLGDAAWTSTRVLLPASLPATPYTHLLTGEEVTPDQGADGAAIAAARAMRTCPVALLWTGGPADRPPA